MTLTMAPGFIDLETLFAQRVIELGWDVIVEAVELSTQLHTQAAMELLNAVVTLVNEPQERYYMPMVSELQPLQGEYDSPRPGGQRISYTRGYPLWDRGWAWATNRKSRVKLTVQEANEFTSAGLRADMRWMIRHTLAAWFTNVDYTFEDEEHGDVPVGCLANGDTQEYLDTDGNTFTDTHFLAQLAAIDDANDPFPTIEEEINEHPENTGDVVAYIPTNLKTSVTALTGVYEDVDEDVSLGVATDQLGGTLNIPFGDKLIGKHESGVWLVHWRRLPDNYIPFHSLGAGPFIGMRQEPEAELQGFRPEVADVDGNLMVQRMLRTAGFAARNRIAAGVMRIGNASYAIPTGYQAPLPQ